MSSTEGYTEPLTSFIARRHFHTILAFAVLVALIAIDASMAIGTTKESTGFVILTNVTLISVVLVLFLLDHTRRHLRRYAAASNWITLPLKRIGDSVVPPRLLLASVEEIELVPGGGRLSSIPLKIAIRVAYVSPGGNSLRTERVNLLMDTTDFGMENVRDLVVRLREETLRPGFTRWFRGVMSHR